MSRKHMWVIVASEGVVSDKMWVGTIEDEKVTYRLGIEPSGRWKDLNYKPQDVFLSIVDHLNKNFSEPIK